MIINPSVCAAAEDKTLHKQQNLHLIEIEMVKLVNGFLPKAFYKVHTIPLVIVK